MNNEQIEDFKRHINNLLDNMSEQTVWAAVVVKSEDATIKLATKDAPKSVKLP